MNFKTNFSFDELYMDELNDNYKGYLYELIGLINHYERNIGHNYSYLKNFFNDQWCEYNNEKVYPIDEENICTEFDFPLLYKLKNEDEKYKKRQ